MPVLFAYLLINRENYLYQMKEGALMNNFRVGEEVYVIYRNPHAVNVANIEKAEIVEHPHSNQELALFLHDAYHPLAEDDAVFSSFEDAEELYNQLFNYKTHD